MNVNTLGFMYMLLIIILLAREACLVSGICSPRSKQPYWKCVRARANKYSSSPFTLGLWAVMKIGPSLHGGNVFIILEVYCINNRRS